MENPPPPEKKEEERDKRNGEQNKYISTGTKLLYMI